MLQDLIRRLAGPPIPHPLHPDDARLAMAALMVRISRTDGSYSTAERRRIDAMLIERYRLDPAAAARVRAEAETAEAGAQDTVQFTRLIKQAQSPTRSAPASSRRCGGWPRPTGSTPTSAALMRLVGELLGVSDVDSGLARQRALGDAGSA